jgi:hypothetical protein
MNRKNWYRVVGKVHWFALIAVTGLSLMLSASGAKANCFYTYKAGEPARIPNVSPAPPQEPSASREGDDWERHRSIVGLWHLVYTATSSNLPSPPFPSQTPFTFVESYKMWHSDGTEFDNATLPPAGGNICYGVWKDLGDGRVKLHHIGVMYGPDGSPSNIFTQDEIDQVSPDGKTYKGSFDFKLFPASDTFGTGTPLAEAKGTTAGTRITVD